MPLVDVNRASDLDKIHIDRMFHAFAQVFVRLIALEDESVNSLLRSYSIQVFPGPIVGIEYAKFAKQILEKELKAKNLEIAKASRPVKKAKKKK